MKRRLVSTWSRQYALLLLVLGAAAGVYLLFVTVGGTPRARMNLTISVAVAVFLLSLRSALAQENAQLATPNPPRTMRALAPVLFIGTLVWIPMLPYYFISEDFLHLVLSQRPLLASIVDQTIHGEAHMFVRPAAFATIFLEYRLWGTWPVGYHITNIAIHLLTAVAIYKICVYAQARVKTGVCAALIYAVLPVHAETVAWMGARFDVLSACLAAWSVAFYLKYRMTSSRRAFFACAVCALFAVLSKENAFVLPLIFLAAELWVLPDRRFGPLVWLSLLDAALFAYRWLALGGLAGYANTDGPIVLAMRLKTLEGLFVRAPARTLMGYNWVQPDTIGLIPVAALTCGILLAAAWRFSPETGQRGWLAFGFVWVILAALPIHPLLFIDASVMNGRTLHLGSIGLVLFIAQILQGGTRGFHWGLTAFLAVLLGLGTVHNLGAWRWTSQLTRQTLSEVQALEPAPEPGTHFVFHDLPDSERGVFFLRTVSESLQIIYQRQDVSGQRRENGPVSGNHVIHLRWKGNQPPILERIPE